MKKILKISAMCAAVFALVLTGCSKQTYVVTFDSQGGSLVTSVQVQEGKKLDKPADPTKTGFDFAGWYKEAATTTAWDFATDVVSSDITLYAKWTESKTVTLNSLKHSGNSGVGTERFYAVFKTALNKLYVLDLYSPSAVSAGAGLVSPEAGTYNLDETSAGGALTIGAYYSGIAEGNLFVGKFVSGSAKITKVGDNYKVEGDFIDDQGAKIVFVYEGVFAAEIYDPYSAEPAQSSPQSLITSTGLYQQGEEYYAVYIFDEATYDEAYFILFSNGGLDGTYQINNTMTAGTCLASQGGTDSEGYPNPSYLWNDNVFYIVSGTVTISGQNVTVAATSAHGTTISVSCSDLTQYQPSTDAPAKILKKTFTSKDITFGKKPILKKIK